MNINIHNPFVVRIMIAARKQDTIRAISQRIQVSYGWTYKWIQELIHNGIFKARGMKIYAVESHPFYKKTQAYIKDIWGKDVQFYYEAIDLFGVSYCFTGLDAVFVWTQGGYNISRYKRYYPIFIKIKKTEKPIFEEYCKKWGLRINQKSGIFYTITYVDSLSPSWCQGIPVDSLEETMTFMQQHPFNFEPALEMIKEMYKKKIPVQYKEVVTNV